MTTANKITILRILLIPVFIAFAIYYGKSCDTGAPDERWRWAATFTFLFAAVTDGLDGFIARHFNQRTRLGSILDPIADKGLLLAAVITLSVTNWPHEFPLWFPILVITRDVLTTLGALLLGHVVGLRELTPHWSGKVATVTQMVALGWLMLRIPWPPVIVPTVVAGIFTFWSGMVYLAVTLRALQAAPDAGSSKLEAPSSKE